jgi:hypothetical protein
MTRRQPVAILAAADIGGIKRDIQSLIADERVVVN